VIEAQYRLLVVQWRALREAVTSIRDEDGMATLEVVMITASLVVVAGLLITLLHHTFAHHTARIT